MRRVNETLKQVISEGISELKDPGIGFVTVTGVEATTDLEEATVYVSVYGSENDRRATLEALRRASGVLQARVNRELHLRRTPLLAFAYDESVERGVRMSKLIDELAPADEPSDDPE
jgi:ribosome-binding factor A